MRCAVCRRFARGNEDRAGWSGSSSERRICPACVRYLNSDFRLAADDGQSRLADLVDAGHDEDPLQSFAALAIHEAGHATMHAVLGIGLTSVTIDPSGGVVRGGRLEGNRISVAYLWNCIWAIVAGPAAENKFIACIHGEDFAADPQIREAWGALPARPGALTDYQMIAGCFREPLAPEALALFWRIGRRCVDEYWQEIVAVGWLLHRRRTLGGALVRSIVGDLRHQLGAPFRVPDLGRERASRSQKRPSRWITDTAPLRPSSR